MEVILAHSIQKEGSHFVDSPNSNDTSEFSKLPWIVWTVCNIDYSFTFFHTYNSQSSFWYASSIFNSAAGLSMKSSMRYLPSMQKLYPMAWQQPNWTRCFVQTENPRTTKDGNLLLADSFRNHMHVYLFKWSAHCIRLLYFCTTRKCRVGASTEWETTFKLGKDKDGFLRKDTVRTVYDGSFFSKVASKKKGPSANQAWLGFWKEKCTKLIEHVKASLKWMVHIYLPRKCSKVACICVGAETLKPFAKWRKSSGI